MKKIFSIILLCSSIALSSCKHFIVLHDTAGHAVSIKGKWVVLSYWADWCENCADEVPELNRFYVHHLSDDILFFGVNYDALPRDQLLAAMKKMQMIYPSLLDNPLLIWHLDPIQLVPILFIINPEGKVVAQKVGPVTAKELERFLSKSSR